MAQERLDALKAMLKAGIGLEVEASAKGFHLSEPE